MAGDLNFKVGFETEQAASSFRQLFQEYINGSAKAGDEANKLLGGTIKKSVEVRLEVDKQSGTRELTTVINRARTELDQYERQFKRATRVEPGSITSIRQALREARQARDAVRQFADYAADASGKVAFKGPESERYVKAQQRVKDFENQIRSLEAASGSAFDRIKIGLNLDTLFKAGKQLNDIVSVFQSLEIAINAVTAPIKAVTKALADLQSFALSFEAIGAGASGAGIALSESSRIALGLGVNIKTVREGMQQLSPVILNAGGGLGDVSSIMEALSSRFAAFGLNADKSRRVMNGVIQAFSKGKLMAEELTQQISEADPAFKSDLAKALKVSTSELERMVKAGEVTSDVLIKILPSLSKSSLFFGKLGDSATSAVDALDNGNAILSQVENNIASIAQLNLEAFAKIAEPIVSSFLRAQAVVVDFIGRISKLESVKAIINIFSAIGREAIRVADVFLRVAEGFLIVLSPIAKLVNLLLEIPVVSSLVGLSILGNLVKPLQALSKSVGENIIQQSGFTSQIKAVWSDIGKPFDGLINRIRGVNREIAASLSGGKIDLFKDGQKGAIETSSAIRGISQTSRGVSLSIQKDFENAFNSAKIEANEVKGQLNQLRKVMDAGTFVPAGSESQRTLRQLRAEADALKASFVQIAPATSGSISQISNFRNQLIGLFGDVKNQVVLGRLQDSIANIRTTDPIRALGLLQAALRELRVASRELTDDPNLRLTRYFNALAINETKGLIASVAKDLKNSDADIAGSLKGVSGSFGGLENSVNQLGSAAEGGLSDISRFKNEFKSFGDISKPLGWNLFQMSVEKFRTTDPVRSLGLLRAAYDELSREASEFTKKTPEWKKFVNARDLKDIKGTIEEVSRAFIVSGTDITSSAEKMGRATSSVNDSFNKLNADKLLIVESQIAEGESQVTGSALKLREQLDAARGRMDAAAGASKSLASSIKDTAVPAVAAFSRETELLAKKRDLENRLRGIQQEFSSTVRTINRDARTLAKVNLPGGSVTGANAEAAIAKIAERGNLDQVDREGKLKTAIEARNQAQAGLIPSLRAVNAELLNMKLNNDAVALFPKNLSAIGTTARTSAGSLAFFNGISRASSAPLKLAGAAVSGLRGLVMGLFRALGPLGQLLLGIQVSMAAWANVMKGTEKGMKEGQAAVDAYKTALEDLRGISPDDQAEGVSKLENLWNNFSLGIVNLMKKTGNDVDVLIKKIQNYQPPEWFKKVGDFFGSIALFDDRVLPGLGEPQGVQENILALRQYTNELDAVVSQSNEATGDSRKLAGAIGTLGAAAAADSAAKQRQINAYVQYTNALALQEDTLEKYKGELDALNAIEAKGGKLTDIQKKKQESLAAAYEILSQNVSEQKKGAEGLVVRYGYLVTAAKDVEDSLVGLSEKLKLSQQLLESLQPGTPEWTQAAADVIIYENKINELKKALSDPIFKKNLIDLRIKEGTKELDLLFLKANGVREALAGGLLTPEDTQKAQQELAALQLKIDELVSKLGELETAKIVVDAEVEFKVNQAGFDEEIAAIRSKLAATNFIASISGIASPELKAAATSVATAFQSASDAGDKFAQAGRAYANAIATSDITGQVIAAQNIAKEGDNYKLAIAEAKAGLQSSLDNLRQGLTDAINELRNLKLGNLDLLPVEEQKEAIRELNKEVQRIVESRGRKATFAGTADQILQAKQRFVDFYNQLDKGENKIVDIKSAMDLANTAIEKLSTLNLGEDGELFKQSIESAGAAALEAQPYIKEIQNSLDNGKIAAEGISASLLSLDGKTIRVNVATVGAPGRWAGGPASPGTTYRVNELGKEGFLSNSGRLTDINRPRNALWRPPTSGTVIPAHIMRSIDVPKAGVSVKGSRVSKIAGSMHSANGSNALIRELRKITQNDSSGSLKQEIATTHAAQTMEIGRLTRAVRELVDKDWNVNVKVRNNGGTAYMNALNRLS